MVIADICFFPNFHADQIIIYDSCLDISNQVEQTHTHSSEDHPILTEGKTRTVHFLIKKDFTFKTKECCSNDFVSVIWQPPKIS